jgi:hypothetical protein
MEQPMRHLIPLAAALALAACQNQPMPAPSPIATTAGAIADAFIPLKPADVMNGTTLDEKAGLIVTRSYTVASRLGTQAARGGMIDRDGFKAADARAYAAVQAVRAAYLTANATSYADAINQAYAAIGAMSAVAGK